MEDETNLGAQISACLEEAIERGMQLPFTMVFVAANGSLMAGRYEISDSGEGLTCDVVAEHVLEPGFVLPVNAMLVDSSNEALRMVINPDGRFFH